jgi:hypothetical protein
MGGVIKLKGLLFTSDVHVLSVMNQALDNFEIETKVCMEHASALDVVTTTKLDTLIMDWAAAEHCAQIVVAMRNSWQNANSTVLAMVNNDPEMQAAGRAGANFVMYKPVSADQATRFVRAAYGSMLVQRRRSTRYEVDIPAVASLLNVPRIEGKVINLSIHGLAFLCGYPIEIEQGIAIEFVLTEPAVLIHATGQVTNVSMREGMSRAGVCFSSVPPHELATLEQWLAEHFMRSDLRSD